MSDLPELRSFRDVIELWPSKEAMGADLRANPSAVSKWWQRDSIPAEWWSAILSSDRASAGGATSDLLTRLAAREPVADVEDRA